MSEYTSFARFYDTLTADVDYDARTAYYDRLIKKYGGKQGGILLDLACGTGTMSAGFSRMGYDVIAVDASEDMLSCAVEKYSSAYPGIQFLCQDMTELDMFGTIDMTVCALDSLNHLKNTEEIRSAFEKVSLFTEPGGLFLFDMNTSFKHREILGNNTFVYDTDTVYCVWKCFFDDENDPLSRVDMELDFFEKQGDVYKRSSECFAEIAPDSKIINTLLEQSGFELAAEYGEDSENPPDDCCERIFRVARKII